jgi:hypothetical protein
MGLGVGALPLVALDEEAEDLVVGFRPGESGAGSYLSRRHAEDASCLGVGHGVFDGELTSAAMDPNGTGRLVYRKM